MKRNKLTNYIIYAFDTLLADMEGESEKTYILMKPDFKALFWDESGTPIGSATKISSKQVSIGLKPLPALQSWYAQYEEELLYHTHNWKNPQWKEWWKTGLGLAREVNKLLPSGVVLYYFTLNDKVWAIRPEETLGGGEFDLGVPMRID